METVDADVTWAAYKLVGTIAEDGSHRIFFFTDPTEATGQLRLLVLSADYSQTWFDSEIRSWGETTDPTDASDATDPTDPTDTSDASDATDATDASDATDATDPTDAGCTDFLTVETPLPDDASVQDITLKLGCWDATTGTPESAAYTDAYNNYTYLELTDIRMETVDADVTWAAHKLVGTIADDGSHRIFFFTDPTAPAANLDS